MSKTEKQEKKDRKIAKIIRGIIIVILIIIILPWAINFISDITSPEPYVVSRGVDDLSSELLEYSYRVWAEIRNDGADGDVVIQATLKQDGEEWTKTKRVFMTRNETKKYFIKFDEVKLLGGEVTGSVIAY